MSRALRSTPKTPADSDRRILAFGAGGPQASDQVEHDAKRLPQLLADVCGVRGYPDRRDVITADQWRAILTAMGASPLDVAEIVRRIGIPLDT